METKSSILIDAWEVINKAYDIATKEDFTPVSSFKTEIYTVLSETHLTYRYIMVNAFLAKATDPKINPLCLQKSSKLDGAYDARTLCHKVLVRFEKEKLSGALGSSNEPFLNKPARIPELSTDNPVRKGKDSKLLGLLCAFLPTIITKEQAFDALTDAIYYALQLAKDKEEMIGALTINTPSFIELENFVQELLTKSFGGESLALAIGALMNIFTESLAGETRVEVHVVNQSGASSQEISDIDVYLNNEILYAIEAKDKEYATQDVMHAVDKAAISNCSRLMFITGPNGKLISSEISHAALINKALEKGVYLTFLGHLAFTKLILSLSLEKSFEEFFQILLDISNEARLKPDTVKHFIEVAKRNGLAEVTTS
ncbi:restriction endonuclease, SacI family [Priestia endophytica]|uniref:restriction endonuclease, SacI family n=1 Tax=Priestia endophytica TaxID=135735 RepID=UPI0022825DC3|nr:restriction endonuclease, SacI family [Priestia endophytica]MCY8233884.1 restriction endonuclease, SacI family [Priestia endophytica]